MVVKSCVELSTVARRTRQRASCVQILRPAGVAEQQLCAGLVEFRHSPTFGGWIPEYSVPFSSGMEQMESIISQRYGV